MIKALPTFRYMPSDFTRRLWPVAIALMLFLSPFSESIARERVSPGSLVAALRKNISRVEEFQFIREQAEQMGVKAYLFGGAAMAYGTYTKWDLERLQRLIDVSGEPFDYDIYNIINHQQDIDIVIDGNEEQVKRLEKLVQKQFDYRLPDNRPAWEFRPLRQSMGTPNRPFFKEALLDDFDFANQNTDTASTGLIEITRSSDPIVRDLLAWNKRDTAFLNYLIADRITLLRSQTHKQTSRYNFGQNPEIFSVIRALSKAAQYLLRYDDNSYREMLEIVRQTDVRAIQNNPVALRRIIDLGKKLFMSARSVEYAWDEAERLGLRKLLMQFDNPNKVGSLAWWMNKQPLRRQELGLGNGRTAAELGIDIVSHQTDSLQAGESISRNLWGYPNAFISRDDAPGERAKRGEGFYVRQGFKGASAKLGFGEDDGYTVRFRLMPNARENTDFVRVASGILILNKEALRAECMVVDGSPLEIFKSFLATGYRTDVSSAIKYTRQLEVSSLRWSRGDEEKIVQLVMGEFDKEKKSPRSLNLDVVLLWFQLPVSTKYPQLIDALADFDQTETRRTGRPMNRFGLILESPHWQKSEYFLNHSHWRDNRESFQWSSGTYVGNQILELRDRLLAAMTSTPASSINELENLLDSPDPKVVSEAAKDAVNFKSAAVTYKLMQIIEMQLNLSSQKPNTYILNSALESLSKMMAYSDRNIVTDILNLYELKKAGLERNLGRSFKYTQASVDGVKKNLLNLPSAEQGDHPSCSSALR